MNYAETLRDHVESSLKSTPEMHEELRAVAKRLYPESKFVGSPSEA